MSAASDSSRAIALKVDFGAGRRGLEAFCESSREICESSVVGATDAFRATASVLHLGSVLMFESQTTPVVLRRTLRHIAGGDLDHYQLQLPISGRIQTGEQTLEVGDLGVHDMSRPSAHELIAGPGDARCHHLMLMIPRARLAPMLASGPGAAHALRLRSDDPYTGLLREHLDSLHRYAPALTSAQRETATQSLLVLLAGSVDGASPQRSSPAAQRSRRRAKLAVIKRFLDEELAPDEVAVAALCRRFAMSRATLYRLFEEEGGLASYLRERRLQRAARALTSPAHQHLRILDIAVNSHFGSDTAFSRAFKRRFGLSPSELRAGATAGSAHHGDLGGGRRDVRALSSSLMDPLSWIRDL